MTTFHVSKTGSDAGDGLTAATAFKSLGKAQLAMRQSDGHDTTLVHAGNYDVRTTMTLDAGDAGSAFIAAPGETVELSGGRAVVNWTKGANGIWTAPLQQADLNQLTFNGERMTEARYPNTVPEDPLRGGWLWAEKSQPGMDNLRQMAFDTSDFTSAKLAAGMRVHVFSDLAWSTNVLTVKTVDWVKGIVTFNQPADYPLGEKSRFFAQDAKVHLDQKGEWFFDTSTKTIHFKAPDGFDGSGIVASGNHSIFNLTGTTDIRIEGFKFRDIATNFHSTDSREAAIQIDSSARVTITNNSFENVSKAVYDAYGSNNLKITNNDFSHIWAAAVEFGHTSHSNVVTGNSIWKTGEVFIPLGAVHINEGRNNIISENLFRDTPRSAIQDSHYDETVVSGNNLFQNNIILHSVQNSTDNGPIYIYANQDSLHRGDVVRNNIMVDTGGLEAGVGKFLPHQSYSYGIYLDDYVSRTQVYGNIVHGTVEGGVYIHGGSSNTVFNNIITGTRDKGLLFADIDRPQLNNNLYNNIVEMPWNYNFLVSNNESLSAPPGSLHDNFYYNPNNRVVEFELNYQLKTQAQWRALGFDMGSDVFNTSLFVSPTTGDYTLKPGSLPLLQGFAPLPLAQMQTFRGGIVKWGAEQRDTLTGGLGGDVLEGLGGNDILSGLLGNDILVGWTGHDTVIGGKGADRLEGGSGTDTADYRTAEEAVRVALDKNVVATGDAAGDIFDSIENLRGSNFNDVLIGDAKANTLWGSVGKDWLDGKAGNDRIIGGAGADTLTGRSGADMFTYYGASEAGDIIRDFTSEDGFRFAGAKFGAKPPGQLAITSFQSSTSNIATKAAVRFFYETDTGILHYDADGTGTTAAVVIATLPNKPVVTYDDIWFF